MSSDLLSDYDPSAFPRVAVTVDVAMFTIREGALRVLLIRRGNEPFLGDWALPGGFVNPDEGLDTAATRELAEETGIAEESAYFEQLASYGSPDRDPRMRVITVAYWAICANLPTPVGNTDAAEAALMPVSLIEEKKIRLAFDHEKIVRDALERMRSSLESLSIAAKFCPPRFSIGELREVYETIWETDIDKGNFQRKVRANRFFRNLSALRESHGNKGGRPASLWSSVLPSSANVGFPPRGFVSDTSDRIKMPSPSKKDGQEYE